MKLKNELEVKNELSHGGLVIVIPYRDRQEHLDIFRPHMETYLKDLPYTIMVVEQYGEKLFNRGKLINVGFTIANRINKDVYFSSHDVDFIPERGDYSRPTHMVHLGTHVEQFGYRFHPKKYEFFGGVNLFPAEDFIKVDGFGNNFWGWGAEDDDLRFRFKRNKVEYSHDWNGRYWSLPHEPQKHKRITRVANEKILRRRTHKNNGLSTLKAKVVSSEVEPGYIHIVAKI